MRSRSRTLALGIGGFFLVAALAAPSFAAKKVISDAELDNVTAAGEPTVITTAGASSSVTFTATTSAVLTLAGTGQTNLRALTLNNVVGENQVANGVNISSASGVGGSQTNTITQSWGSINDHGSASVAGVSALAVAVQATCNIAFVNAGCQGGPATAIATPAPGQLLALTTASDVIISTAGANSPVSYSPTSIYTLTIGASGEGPQDNLVALIVNNIAGLNQVATGLNIAAFGVTVTNTGVTLGSGGAGGAGPAQTNTIGQYQGVPAGFTRH